MKKKLIAGIFTGAFSAACTVAVKKAATDYLDTPDNKKKALDFAHSIAMKAVGKIADGVSDKGIPYLNRYENKGFLEGNGYFLKNPAKGAFWSMGYAKASIIPPVQEGDYYIGGYLAFPPNKMNGIMNEQKVRAFAIDDNSGRGIHVFAVIDCIGISGTDIREIRNYIWDVITEKNILSVNISATHCHSGIDTEGLWGDLPKAFKQNKKAIKKGKPQDTVSGKNEGFMKYLKKTSGKVIKEAVNNMTCGKLYYTQADISEFVRDKRPPYITDNSMTVLKFIPENGGKEIMTVYMAAHPTCYGYRHREASRDFPGYFCDKMEEYGFEAIFTQGAEAAVATDRGPHTPEGLSTDGNIKAYGEAIAKFVNKIEKSEYKELSPVINVKIGELLLQADNKVLELAAKLKLVNNPLVKITMADDGNKDDKSYELFLVTETGFAQFGNELTVCMVPGELMPEIAVGGTFEDWASYSGEKWTLPSFPEIFKTKTAVAGLCNDFIGYIVPDNDYGSVFAPLHYEEAVSAGKKTASNIVNSLIRLKDEADKITVEKEQTVKE